MRVASVALVTGACDQRERKQAKTWPPSGTLRPVRAQLQVQTCCSAAFR